LLDGTRDLDGLFDVARFDPRLGRSGDAGRAVEAFTYFRDTSL
jgi:hypothetical protein